LFINALRGITVEVGKDALPEYNPSVELLRRIVPLQQAAAGTG